MKNILGLDLGSSSIGWAVIRENSEERELVAMGSRVVSAYSRRIIFILHKEMGCL